MRAPNCSISEQCCTGQYRNAQMAPFPGKNKFDLWIQTGLDTQQVQTVIATLASLEGQVKGNKNLTEKHAHTKINSHPPAATDTEFMNLISALQVILQMHQLLLKGSLMYICTDTRPGTTHQCTALQSQEMHLDSQFLCSKETYTLLPVSPLRILKWDWKFML